MRRSFFERNTTASQQGTRSIPYTRLRIGPWAGTGQATDIEKAARLLLE
jgi:hypothetical protein